MTHIDQRLRDDGARWRDAVAAESTPIYDPLRATRRGTRRRWLAPLAAAAAVVAVAVAVTATVARHTGSHSGSASSARGSADPLIPQAPSALPPASPAPLVTAKAAKHELSLPWLFLSLSHDGRTVEVYYATGDGWCVTPVGFEVTELPDSVQLKAVSREDTTRQACPANLEVGHADVRLPSRLAGRALLHAPVSKGWTNVANVLRSAR